MYKRHELQLRYVTNIFFSPRFERSLLYRGRVGIFYASGALAPRGHCARF